MALIPSQTAAAAPGNPTTASVCPANASRRSTMNQPITPASTATTVPARKAFTMKWKSNSWATSRARFQLSGAVASASTSDVAVAVMSGCFGLTHHDEAAVGRPQHLDGRAVQLRQRLGRDDLLGWAGHGAAG